MAAKKGSSPLWNDLKDFDLRQFNYKLLNDNPTPQNHANPQNKFQIMTYNGGVVESTDLSGEDQRGRRALHCLDEGAEAGTRDEELGGDVVAAHLPLRPPRVYPVLRQCSKHKGIRWISDQGSIQYLQKVTVHL